MSEYREVRLPEELLEKVEEHIKNTEFSSVEEYITFVLEEVLKDEEEVEFSEEHEKEIKERLKALGYLE